MEASIKTRRVYYLSGFDPRGAAYYYRLYREEARKQAQNTGFNIRIGKALKQAEGSCFWYIKCLAQGHSTTTEYHFLSWTGIIRKHWKKNLWQLARHGLQVYFRQFQAGLFTHFRKWGRGPFFSFLFPIFYFSLLLLSVLLCAASTFLLASAYSDEWLLKSASVLLTTGVVMWLGLKIAAKWGVIWILQTHIFISAWAARHPADVECRIKEFTAEIIKDQQAATVDEILLVGHSVGAILAVSVLARLLKKNPQINGNIKLVTLGQCIPYLSMAETAHTFRHDLVTVTTHPRTAWIDMGANADPLCFSRINPSQFEGAPFERTRWPKTQIVHPYLMYQPQTYKKMRYDKLRLHFLYLMSSDRPSDYDYFRMTAGPYRLRTG